MRVWLSECRARLNLVERRDNSVFGLSQISNNIRITQPFITRPMSYNLTPKIKCWLNVNDKFATARL